ncbi:MAG: hypothetical protein ACYCSS_15295 [Sulfuriferula sp.]
MNANKSSKKIRLLGKFISVGKFFLIIFSVIFVGFVGGAFSPFLLVGLRQTEQLAILMRYLQQIHILFL